MAFLAQVNFSSCWEQQAAPNQSCITCELGLEVCLGLLVLRVGWEEAQATARLRPGGRWARGPRLSLSCFLISRALPREEHLSQQSF